MTSFFLFSALLGEKSKNFSISGSSYSYAQQFELGKLTWVITMPLHFSKTALHCMNLSECVERTEDKHLLFYQPEHSSSKTTTICLN